MKKQPKIKPCSTPVGSTLDDDMLRAEIMWTTFICEKDLPPNLSDDASKLFSSMFPDSKIANKFNCARTKTSYMISDGIGPELHDRLVCVLQNQPFSLLIDESNKKQGKKYLNILVRYFDGVSQNPETKFYKTVEVGSKADDIVDAISKCFEIDNIPWKNVLQVMTVSPECYARFKVWSCNTNQRAIIAGVNRYWRMLFALCKQLS